MFTVGYLNICCQPFCAMSALQQSSVRHLVPSQISVSLCYLNMSLPSPPRVLQAHGCLEVVTVLSISITGTEITREHHHMQPCDTWTWPRADWQSPSSHFAVLTCLVSMSLLQTRTLIMRGSGAQNSKMAPVPWN